MVTFTLDTNCLIAVEERRPEATAVLDLVARHRAGSAVVRLVATMAAENQRDGTVLDNFSGFQQRLRELGLADLEILRPICVLDLSYLEWCVIAHEEAENESRRLHAVLFPSAPFDYRDAVPEGLDASARQKAERNWRNKRLDVLVLHTHIMAGADVFVTSDRNFRKDAKQARLDELGAGLILPPSQAAHYGVAAG